MVKEIVKDIDILTKESEPFVFGEDDELIQDMIDTANEHSDRCVGLAAVQIGVHKRAILVKIGDKFVPMINPIIIKRSPQTYVTKEGCLSLDGTRTVKRHKSVYVVHRDVNGKKGYGDYIGFEAEIIQHEIDHLNGVLI